MSHLQTETNEALMAELERRGVFVALDGAIGALYDQLERIGSFDCQSGLTEYLAKRMRLEAAKLGEMRGFAGGSEAWEASLADMGCRSVADGEPVGGDLEKGLRRSIEKVNGWLMNREAEAPWADVALLSTVGESMLESAGAQKR